MKLVGTTLIFLVVLGCNLGNKTKKDQSKYEGEVTQGNFQAEINGKIYRVAIECNNFGDQDFRFQSDETDVADSNGDGLSISGQMHGNALGLTIMEFKKDEIEQYSTTPTTKDWKIDGNTLEGSAKFVKGTSNSEFFEGVSFEINCN